MSRVISFRTDDEIAEVIDREADRLDDETTRAGLTKQLVEEAADARTTPLWLQIGMSNRDAARLEDLRQRGESEDVLARELLGEALEARGGDVLDELEVGDDLRERVEAAREEGETLDDAVRRLVREGAKATADDGTDPFLGRVFTGALLLLTVGMPAAFAAADSTGTAGAIILGYVLMVIFSPQVDRLQGFVRGGVSSAWGSVRE